MGGNTVWENGQDFNTRPEPLTSRKWQGEEEKKAVNCVTGVQNKSPL